jgi:hypothetical protein
MQDKAVFQYREERQLQYWSKGQNMNQDAFREQYNAEQFKLVHELLENNHGDVPTGQGRR